MKGRTLLWLVGLLMVANVTVATITTVKTAEGVKLTCNKGNWTGPQDYFKSELVLLYKDVNSDQYTCNDDKNAPVSYIYVKFRTCDNCIELDATAATAITVGNLVATILIGVAVYTIAAQPGGRGFPGNKASDKQALLREDNSNRNRTYEPLRAGHHSDEYSMLGGGRKR